MTEVTTQMQQNRRQYERTVADIRSDEDLSEKAKTRMIEEAYNEATAKQKSLAEQQRASVEAKMQEARKAAFAPPNIYGADRAALMTSYRDALDRVSGTREVEKLEQILERANLVGDELLAKAILVRGYELQNEELVSAYLSGHPEERRSWDKFVSAAEEYNSVVGEDLIESAKRRLATDLGPARPPELGG